MFSEGLNKIVKVGFGITAFIFFVISVGVSRLLYENGSVVWFILFITGLFISFVMWSFIGTISEMGIELRRIRKLLEKEGGAAGSSYEEEVGEKAGGAYYDKGAGGEFLPEDEMTYVCAECGAHLSDEGDYCSKCGAPAPWKK